MMIAVRSSIVLFTLMLAANPDLLAGQTPPATPTDASQAQPSETDTVPTSFADEITVTADRVEQKVKDVPATVIVISKEDIGRSAARTIDELLRQIPGFALLRQGSSMAAAPAVRGVSLQGIGGASSSRALVLVDGVPVNDPFTGSVYWARIPLESIDHIEVVTGGTSVVWGNLAMAGVIHIVTVSPQERSFRVSTEGGSNDTGKLHLSAAGGRGAWRGGLSASYFETGGYYTLPSNQRGAVDRPVADVYRTLDGSVVYEPSTNTRWSVGGNVYTEDQDSGTPLSVNTIQTGYLRAGGEFDRGAWGRWQFSAFLTRQNTTAMASSVSAGRQSETPASNQFDVPARQIGTMLQWSRTFGTRHVLAAGFDQQRIDVTINEDLTFTGGRFTRRRESGGHQTFDGLYVEDTFLLAQGTRLVGAVRFDRWTTADGSRDEVDSVTGASLRSDAFPDQRQWAGNPSLGLRQDVTRHLSIKASVYRAFRAPTGSELYRPFRARGNVINESNAFLSPERLTGVRAGFEATPTPSVRTRLTGFWNRIDDPVVTVTIREAGATGRAIDPCGFVAAGGVCRQRQNLGRVQSRGVDSDVEYRLTGGWIVSGGYQYAQSTVLAAPNQPQLVGKASRQTPGHQVVLGVSYDNPRLLNFSLQERYVSDRFDDDLNEQTIAGFALTDLRIGRTVSARGELFLSIQNALNRTYEVTHSEDTIGIGAPRLVNAGLRWRF